MVLHLLLLGSASALHPDIRRLESLALQQFGHRQLASFKEANRQLNEMVGTSTDPTSSANNGDISSMCANEQFLQFCSMNDAQLEQTVATSANDGAANGGTSDATAANVCALKAMQGFYCNTLCSPSCEAFLSAGGDGEALSQSSANDDAAGGGTGAGTGAATQADPTAAIEDMLGQVCGWRGHGCRYGSRNADGPDRGDRRHAGPGLRLAGARVPVREPQRRRTRPRRSKTCWARSASRTAAAGTAPRSSRLSRPSTPSRPPTS